MEKQPVRRELHDGSKKLVCKKVDKLPGKKYAPPLEMDKEYPLLETCFDSAGNPHYNVGLTSKLESVSSFETGEPLPDGDKIHWCHPSRFVEA